MKIDFNFVPTDIQTGEPIKMGDVTNSDATLAKLCVQALGAVVPGDQDMSAEDKVRAWTLGGKIVKGGVVEVSVEEISLLKKRVGKLYGPFVVGPCHEALERDASHLHLVSEAAKEVAHG